MLGHQGRRTGPAGAAVVAVLLTGGCGLLPAAVPSPADPAPTSVGPPAGGSTSSSPSPQPSTTLPSSYGLPGSVPTSAAPTSAAPRPTRTAAPAPVGLQVEPVVVEGRSGSVSWEIESVRFSGGRGAPEVNRRVRAAVEDMVRRGKAEARRDGGDRRRITGTSVVTTNDGRTVQVSAQFVDSLAGTADPSLHVATTAVTTGAGRPILVSELFRDERAAFRALAREVRRAADRSGEGISESDGLAPRRTNWDNWQTSADGMTVLFDDNQLGGRGTRSYTIRWSVVEPLLTRDARRLLAPR